MSDRSSHPPAPLTPGGSSAAPVTGAGGSSSSRARASDGQQTVISNRPPLASPALARSEAPLDTGGLLEGEQLGQFLLEKFVGGGGMGVVFRALDTTLNREVAVKVLSRDQSADEETLRRFRNEAQSAARLNHENIAHVHYVGEDRGLHYIVFEFIDGINIRDLVEQKGPLPLDEALSYTYQISLALEHASSRAVIHRDIKPSNVLITPGGKAKLVDMGLARLNQVAHNDDLTASGVTLGTFDYISPEQARDPRSADVRSDLYSLGCSFFYMLTGRPPFPEGTVLQKLLQHQGDHPPDPRTLRPELPADVTRIVGKLLAKNPAQRYQQPAELIDELATLGEKLGMQLSSTRTLVPLPRPAGSVARWQHHLPWVVPLAALFLIVTGLDFYWSSSSSETGVPLSALPKVPRASEPAAKSASPRQRQPEPAVPAKAPTGTANPTVPSPRNPPTVTDTPSPGNISDDAEKSFEESRPLFNNLFGPLGNELDLERWKERVSQAAREADNKPNDNRLPTAAAPAGSAAGAAPPRVAEPNRSGTASRSAENVLIVGDARGPRTYSSLYAACSEAKSGDIIELRYDGRRAERPIPIANIRLTIRAGEQYRPIVAFRPEPDQVPLKYPPTMVTVSGGQLHVKGVQFEFDVPRDLPTDWALFESQHAELIHLTSCALTIRNVSLGQAAYHSGVAFFDVKAPPGAAGMTMDTEVLEEQIGTIHLQDCIARGEAVLLRDNELQGVRFVWDNGLLATSERLIVANGGSSQPRQSGHIQIQLRRLTAMMQSGLALLTNSQDAPYQLPTEISAEDCILVSKARPPLVEQRGADTTAEYLARLQWSGNRDYFDGFDVFWEIAARDSQAGAKRLRFDEWQEFWRNQSRLQVAGSGAVVWQGLPEATRPFHTHLPADYALDASAAGNAAVGGASDGADAGCLLKQLPTLSIDEAPAPSPTALRGAAGSP